MHKQISEVIHKNVDKVRNMCIVLLITMGVYAKISVKLAKTPFSCLPLQGEGDRVSGGGGAQKLTTIYMVGNFGITSSEPYGPTFS